MTTNDTVPCTASSHPTSETLLPADAATAVSEVCTTTYDGNEHDSAAVEVPRLSEVCSKATHTECGLSEAEGEGIDVKDKQKNEESELNENQDAGKATSDGDGIIFPPAIGASVSNSGAVKCKLKLREIYTNGSPLRIWLARHLLPVAVYLIFVFASAGMWTLIGTYREGNIHGKGLSVFLSE